MMSKSLPVPGDYVSTIDNNYVIYEVIGFSSRDMKKLTIKVIYPKELARQLRAYSVQSLDVKQCKFNLLGSPNTNRILRLLYG